MNNDLISRSALLTEYNDFKDMDCPSGHTVTADYMIELAEVAPTIDAVEVVRCRDCKRWGTGYGGETEHIKVCEFANYMVGENGYCVYGEREMEEKDN